MAQVVLANTYMAKSRSSSQREDNEGLLSASRRRLSTRRQVQNGIALFWARVRARTLRRVLGLPAWLVSSVWRGLRTFCRSVKSLLFGMWKLFVRDPAADHLMRSPCTAEGAEQADVLEAGELLVGQSPSPMGYGSSTSKAKEEAAALGSARIDKVPSTIPGHGRLQAIVATSPVATPMASPSSPGCSFLGGSSPSSPSPAVAGHPVHRVKSAQTKLWGPAGSQCSLCGLTIEDGDPVLTAPSCPESIKVSSKGLAFHQGSRWNRLQSCLRFPRNDAGERSSSSCDS